MQGMKSLWSYRISRYDNASGPILFPKDVSPAESFGVEGFPFCTLNHSLLFTCVTLVLMAQPEDSDKRKKRARE